ncbi:MAG: LytTR family DNA-binding domain-containing protein [Acidobacteriota bacterium]
MKVAIVEDEPLARQMLGDCIRQCEPGVKIVAALEGVADTIAWLKAHGQPDLLFVDIQLGDGTSFDIFRHSLLDCPVVFTTAYDDYVLEAFQSNGIDYLLKPIRLEKVAAALEKYERLKGHFLSDRAAIARALQKTSGPRDRFLVRKGSEFVPVRTADVAYFFSEHKLVFLVTRDGKRHIVDRTLADIESMLEPAQFFRVNRNFLASIDAVSRCTPHGKGKLLVHLIPPSGVEVTVSQERAADFKRWLGE